MAPSHPLVETADPMGSSDAGPPALTRPVASSRQIATRTKPGPIGPEGCGVADADDDTGEDQAHDRASLTSRELQVARLVADRKTYAAIASELFLSRTSAA